jgi:hypothetical protein
VTDETVPAYYGCGHVWHYPADAWEVRLGANPARTLCPRCRQANLDDLSPPPRLSCFRCLKPLDDCVCDAGPVY